MHKVFVLVLAVIRLRGRWWRGGRGLGIFAVAGVKRDFGRVVKPRARVHIDDGAHACQQNVGVSCAVGAGASELCLCVVQGAFALHRQVAIGLVDLHIRERGGLPAAVFIGQGAIRNDGVLFAIGADLHELTLARGQRRATP
ncbi:MAG: hypothetical protein RI902_72 [Pseudomonadota bacterium]